ncbi:MAG: M20/M25/M40 family metallo-hydrolase [Saprospiraceae bacterium]
MKNILLFVAVMVFPIFLMAQAPALQQADVEFPLRFLASDELGGRRTGEMGNDLAARYIAEYFRTYNLQTVEGADDYFQDVPFSGITPPSTAQLTIGDANFMQAEELLMLTGTAADVEAKAVFAGYGWVDNKTGHNDYADLKVADRVVFVLPGTPDAQDPLAVFNSMGKKRQIAAELGAKAVIELYQLPFPWKFFVSYFNKESLQVSKSNGNDISYGFVNGIDKSVIERMRKGKKVKVKLSHSDYQQRTIKAQNVIGVMEGSDPDLKDEYVLVTAHYDHVGSGKNGGGAFTAEDSIFNGARDNAMGTVAMLGAVKSLSQKRPKRSVVFLAVTAEELGLLGSAYYADNPLIPLDKMIFNLNSDGAGYDDTSAISVVGYGRTGTDELVDRASAMAGLKVLPNPAPEQGLYDRSDNVSFARKGVPAINFSGGVTGFSEEIGKYYHQVADEATSVDFPYFTKMCQVFANLTLMIANDDKKPVWTAGDKYEAAGKALYSNE